MKTKTSITENSISRSPLRRGLLLNALALAFACFALAPQARAVCQEGCATNLNTVLGEDALISLNGGVSNTAVGFEALYSNTGGYYNTGIGAFALQFNTTGGENTAIGYGALADNTTGLYNTATGAYALDVNTRGSANTANGWGALSKNKTGELNTATGADALMSNIIGNRNTAVGKAALKENTSADNNTAIGFNALRTNRVGRGNVALGFEAGFNLNTSDNIDIANRAVAGDVGTIRIGTEGTQTDTFIAGINGVTIPTGVAVIVDTDGHLGTTTSSARFKEAIKPMDKASDAILALKPVTFRYKHNLDPNGIPQFGLVAEDVAKVNPDLVARDDHGKPYTVRYEAVNAMLLNEFLKEHSKVEQQHKDFEAAIAQQQKEIEALTATVKQQAAQIQKVSAQLEVNKSAPQTVLNNQ